MTDIQQINRRTPNEEFDSRILEIEARRKAANRASEEMNKRFTETYDMSEVAAQRYPRKGRLG